MKGRWQRVSEAQYDYDTAQIRRTAQEIKSLAERLRTSALPCVQDVRATLDGNFEGRAADALDERIRRTQTDLQNLYGDVCALSTVLMRFANALEEADARAAQIMGQA